MKLPVEVYRKSAETVTYARVAMAGAIVGNLAVSSDVETHSWYRALGFAGVAMADKVDGWIARRQPDGPTAKGAKLDIESDEVITYSTESILAIKDSDPVTAISAFVNRFRDYLVGKKRDELREKKLDAKARDLGKYKTGWINFTTFLQLSPIGEKHPKIIRAMRIGEMALTIASGFDILRSANCSLSDYEFQQQKSKTK